MARGQGGPAVDVHADVPCCYGVDGVDLHVARLAERGVVGRAVDHGCLDAAIVAHRQGQPLRGLGVVLEVHDVDGQGLRGVVDHVLVVEEVPGQHPGHVLGRCPLRGLHLVPDEEAVVFLREVQRLRLLSVVDDVGAADTDAAQQELVEMPPLGQRLAPPPYDAPAAVVSAVLEQRRQLQVPYVEGDACVVHAEAVLADVLEGLARGQREACPR
mmetsp:Transcript_18645/g.58538  ORF Transcript_18645/g.58538 Transcript_18645/m.58538 type:complete len:214 (+) Transcript_18645:816-1457(+)